LYVVGGGDLGTTAAGLDMALKKILDVATAWKAIVLIDEVGITLLTKYCFTDKSYLQADVFLEQRSMNDLERNAMVAVL
jgi:hypothetical protein